MVRTFVLCALAAAAGCSFGDDRPLEGNPDSGPGMDSNTDGPPVTMDKDHLLLSEVKIDTDEFVEIWNPTDRDIDLSNYYLTDFGDYWRYPTSGALVVVSNDFLVRFPAGAMLRSKQVITVAFKTAERPTASYALDIAVDTGTTRTFRDRLVSTTLAQLPLITNSGEIIALFYWDGSSDLVKDVDIVVAGTATTAGNNFKTRTGMTVDGPDVDTIGTPFKADAETVMAGMAVAATDITSYQRSAKEATKETQVNGGNGLTGDDETSEDLKMTWTMVAPTFGTAPAL